MAATGNPKSIVKDGLIFHIDTTNITCYNNSVSTTTAYSIIDLYQNGDHVGTFGSNASVNLDNEGARYMDFDGTDDKLRFSAESIFQGLGATSGNDNNVPYTQDAWFYRGSNPAGVGTSGYSIAGNASSKGIGMQIFNNSGAYNLNVGYRSNSNHDSNYDIPLRKWVYAAYTRDTSSNIRIYINGEPDSSISSGNLAVDYQSSDYFEVGHADSRINSLNGRIAATSVYNRVLSEAEIKQNFQALRHRFEYAENHNPLNVSWL